MWDHKLPSTAARRRRLNKIIWFIWGCSAALIFASGCGATVSSTAPLNQLKWCSSPVVVFINDASAPPQKLATWKEAQAALGFRPLLPAQLPANLCLVSADAIAHDPAQGSHFSLTYAGSNFQALSIAETPALQIIAQPNCSAGVSQNITIATCQLTISHITITVTGMESIQYLRGLFTQLQPNINWEPAH